MLKYGDFILEKVIYDLLLESKIEFSKSFLGDLLLLLQLAKDNKNIERNKK